MGLSLLLANMFLRERVRVHDTFTVKRILLLFYVFRDILIAKEIFNYGLHSLLFSVTTLVHELVLASLAIFERLWRIVRIPFLAMMCN